MYFSILECIFQYWNVFFNSLGFKPQAIEFWDDIHIPIIVSRWVRECFISLRKPHLPLREKVRGNSSLAAVRGVLSLRSSEFFRFAQVSSFASLKMTGLFLVPRPLSLVPGCFSLNQPLSHQILRNLNGIRCSTLPQIITYNPHV